MVHKTHAVGAIKKLIQIHDILDLNLTIQQTFEDQDTWDFAALRDMNIKRAEIMIFHHGDFVPFVELKMYNNRLCIFLKSIAHQYEKDELIPITEL